MLDHIMSIGQKYVFIVKIKYTNSILILNHYLIDRFKEIEVV